MDHAYDSQYYLDEEKENEEEARAVGIPETLEGDAMLIELVHGYPHIYQKQSKDFKNQNMRDRSWAEIASTLNWSVEMCQRRWTRLRERYTKERKLRETESRSGSGYIKRKEFALYENMMFLAEHVITRKSYTNISVPASSQQSVQVISTVCNQATPIPRFNNANIPPALTNQSIPLSSAAPSPKRHNENIPHSSASGLQCTPPSTPLPINRNIPMSSRCLAQVRYTPSPPIHTSTPSPHNLSVPSPHNFSATSQNSSSMEEDSMQDVPERSSEERKNIVQSNMVQLEDGQRAKKSSCQWRKKRKVNDPLESNFLELTSELKSYISKGTKEATDDNSIDLFSKWISSELRKLPEPEKQLKMEEITRIIFRK